MYVHRIWIISRIYIIRERESIIHSIDAHKGISQFRGQVVHYCQQSTTDNYRAGGNGPADTGMAVSVSTK